MVLTETRPSRNKGPMRLLDFSDNILLRISYLLHQRDVFALYSTCRILRKCLAVALRWRLEISSESRKLHNLAKFAVENPYFAASVVNLSLISAELRADAQKLVRTSFLPGLMKRLEEEYTAAPKELKEALSHGDNFSCMLALIMSFVHLEKLSYTEKSQKPVLKTPIIQLMSSGKYLQHLVGFLLEDEIERQSAIPLGFVGSVGMAPKLQAVFVRDVNFDMNFVIGIGQIATSLKILGLTYREYVPDALSGLSTIRTALKGHSHSLMRLHIIITICRSWNLSAYKGVGRMDTDRLGYLQDFEKLSSLRAPVDALLGPNNKRHEGSPIWARNLPLGLEELTLDQGLFYTRKSLRLWRSSQVLKSLLAGIGELRTRCPKLRELQIRCLLSHDFLQFQTVARKQLKDLTVTYGEPDAYETLRP